MTDTDWENKTEVKKGNIGEEAVDVYMIEESFFPYIPDPKIKAAHPIDRLYISLDASNIFFVDVKSKAARNKYPDTGIDTRHYQKYKKIYENSSIDVFLAFVDENSKSIYGGFLSHLSITRNLVMPGGAIWEYPRIENYGNCEIVYFPTHLMDEIRKLTDEEVENLKKYTTKNVAYL
jgi:hypothetical protein